MCILNSWHVRCPTCYRVLWKEISTDLLRCNPPCRGVDPDLVNQLPSKLHHTPCSHCPGLDPGQGRNLQPQYQPELRQQYQPQYRPQHTPQHQPQNTPQYIPQHQSQYQPQHQCSNIPHHQPQNAPSNQPPRNPSQYLHQYVDQHQPYQQQTQSQGASIQQEQARPNPPRRPPQEEILGAPPYFRQQGTPAARATEQAPFAHRGLRIHQSASDSSLHLTARRVSPNAGRPTREQVSSRAEAPEQNSRQSAIRELRTGLSRAVEQRARAARAAGTRGTRHDHRRGGNRSESESSGAPASHSRASSSPDSSADESHGNTESDSTMVHLLRCSRPYGPQHPASRDRIRAEHPRRTCSPRPYIVANPAHQQSPPRPETIESVRANLTAIYGSGRELDEAVVKYATSHNLPGAKEALEYLEQTRRGAELRSRQPFTRPPEVSMPREEQDVLPIPLRQFMEVKELGERHRREHNDELDRQQAQRQRLLEAESRRLREDILRQQSPKLAPFSRRPLPNTGAVRSQMQPLPLQEFRAYHSYQYPPRDSSRFGQAERARRQSQQERLWEEKRKEKEEAEIYRRLHQQMEEGRRAREQQIRSQVEHASRKQRAREDIVEECTRARMNERVERWLGEDEIEPGRDRGGGGRRKEKKGQYVKMLGWLR